MNPRLEVAHVRLEVFIDTEETSTEPLRDCWVYLFWYTLRGEGGFTHEVYVDRAGRYHAVDLTLHGGKDRRPHTSAGTDMLLLPLSDHRGADKAPIFHVPVISPFQLPWSRLPRIPVGKTLAAKSHEFRTMFDWLSEERDVLGGGFVAAGLGREPGARVSRVRSPWHRALALGWDVAVAQGRLAAELKAHPHQAKLLILHHAVDSILTGGKGDGFIDRDAFERDRASLHRFEELQDDLRKAGEVLLRHLDGRAYGEIVTDMNAAGAEAYGRFIEAMAPVYDLLPSIPGAEKYLQAFFEKSKDLLSDKTYKAARKSVKAIWAFFKAAIKVASDPKLKPLRAALIEWATHALPVRIEVDAHGLIHAKLAKGFEATIVDHDIAHKAFIAIDAYNLVVAMKDLAHEWERSGLKNPKALSALSAASSLIGTTAGWRESVMKKAGSKAGEQLWKGAKNVVGVVGNVADAAGSGWQAYKEFETDDTNAAVGQIIGGAGAATQAVGYALAFFGVGCAPVVLMIGAAAAAAGTIWFILADNDDLEDWLNHCWWGKARNHSSTGSKKWSEGPFSSFHKDLERQMRALNRIFFDFEVSWDFRPMNPIFKQERSTLRLSVRVAHLPSEAKLVLEITGGRDGAMVFRPEGAWQGAHAERDSRGQVTELWEELNDLLLHQRVRAEVRMDIYGDGSLWLPTAREEPQSATFEVPLMEQIVGTHSVSA
jgi:hypothetical protein